jgi:DNA-binding CsgD family transcriptional regulator
MGNWLQGKGFPEPAKSPTGRRRGRSSTSGRRRGGETFNLVAGKQAGITEREREVLTWAARGLSSRDTGMVLDIAKRTVDEHLQTAARKLGAANKTQAVAIAIRDRLIEVDPA